MRVPTSPLSLLRPYWNESYHLRIPDLFKAVNFYVHEVQHKGKPAKCVGKVQLDADLLQTSGGVDQRFPLLPVDDDTEVTGQVRLALAIAPAKESGGQHSLRVEYVAPVSRPPWLAVSPFVPRSTPL